VFKGLGLLVAFYAIFAAFSGEVYAKAGAAGRTVSRSDSPEYFWVVIAIYAALSVALLVVF
jgi:hypothetical protein